MIKIKIKIKNAKQKIKTKQNSKVQNENIKSKVKNRYKINGAAVDFRYFHDVNDARMLKMLRTLKQTKVYRN